MSDPPAQPKIYHITHVDNLGPIIRDGALCSDSVRIATGRASTTIGMTEIKNARLRRPVTCHDDTCVGDYVPFYFCPRSVMLFVISRSNHPGLAYTGGQVPIVHLEADLRQTVAWADDEGVRWAFTPINARTGYNTIFHADLSRLGDIDWESVRAAHWRAPQIKEAKQAEFLMHERFPWHLVSRIGVISSRIKERVDAELEGAAHRPTIIVNRAWYY